MKKKTERVGVASLRKQVKFVFSQSSVTTTNCPLVYSKINILSSLLCLRKTYLDIFFKDFGHSNDSTTDNQNVID